MRVGQNRMYAPYTNVYSVISLPNTHGIYIWFWPTLNIGALWRSFQARVDVRPCVSAC